MSDENLQKNKDSKVQGHSPDSQKDLLQNLVVRALEGDSQAAKIIASSYAGNLAHEESEKEEMEELLELIELQKEIEENSNAIIRSIERYRELAKKYDDLIKKTHEAMEGISQKITKNEVFIQKAKDLLDNEKKTGRLDRNQVIAAIESEGEYVDKGKNDKTLKETLEQKRKKNITKNVELSEAYGELGKIHEEAIKNKKQAESTGESLEYKRDDLLKEPDAQQKNKKLENLNESSGKTLISDEGRLGSLERQEADINIRLKAHIQRLEHERDPEREELMDFARKAFKKSAAQEAGPEVLKPHEGSEVKTLVFAPPLKK